jgi:hypothetical protein
MTLIMKYGSLSRYDYDRIIIIEIYVDILATLSFARKIVLNFYNSIILYGEETGSWRDNKKNFAKVLRKFVEIL